ncbi:MAG TPA: GerMN domain-containing protein [Candidatus Alectryocaccomicrobium excrementavium]|uniref:GerMN domain-containing protein n=1 Tax=Candidatus Alectryocaccomicrobium excrementavium TaxID=2840668 RepID=A0A9D1K4S2_9FIRM|nr:GerMN domain-containing protein [Candidatus Alectryocaccomicrobium excrementavium]
MRGKKGILCLMLAILLGVSGCSNLMLFEAQSTRDVELPEISGEDYVAPWGDSQADYLERAGIYYINEDAQQLARSEISYLLTPSEDQMVTVLNRLLGETPDDVAAVAPEGTRLLGVEAAGSVVTVNLSLEARGADSDQRILWLYAAIANTLTEMSNITGVNILINGRQEAVLSLPMGVMAQSDGDLTALWAQQQADAQRAQLSETSSTSRTALLYFPAMEGAWFVAEPRDLTFVDGNYATALLAALSQPAREVSARPVLNAVNELLSTPSVVLTEEGFRFLQLDFSEQIHALMDEAGVSAYEFVGMLALTMTSFVPAIDGVQVSVEGSLLREVSDGETVHSFADGVFLRSHFADEIGSVVKLYFRAEEGGLIAVERVVSPLVARSPRLLLIQLMQDQNGYASAFPAGCNGDDILGVRIADGVAHVNWSANFYRLCQNLDYAAERDLVYAIVNTLTELTNVRGVQFSFEGRLADTLANSIYLKTVLLRNPGLVQDE